MPSKLSIADTLPLPNSAVQIPRLGFGVYRSPPHQCEKSVLEAVNAGYRHIDTAQFYANEDEVGHAVRSSGLDRKDLFITTKILSPAGSSEATYDKILESVRKIGGENGYVDLFLIHSASCGAGGRKTLWLALERLLAEGKTKSIGVSNFGQGHIEELRSYAKLWPPHVNQLELHPWCQQRKTVQYCNSHGIVVEAYCPLVRNYKASEPTLVSLAEKYGKATGQILIRYSLQKGWVPLPKSDNPERIKGNSDVYGFELSDEDISSLDALDREREGAIVQYVDDD